MRIEITSARDVAISCRRHLLTNRTIPSIYLIDVDLRHNDYGQVRYFEGLENFVMFGQRRYVHVPLELRDQHDNTSFSSLRTLRLSLSFTGGRRRSRSYPPIHTVAPLLEELTVHERQDTAPTSFYVNFLRNLPNLLALQIFSNRDSFRNWGLTRVPEMMNVLPRSLRKFHYDGTANINADASDAFFALMREFTQLRVFVLNCRQWVRFCQTCLCRDFLPQR